MMADEKQKQQQTQPAKRALLCSALYPLPLHRTALLSNWSVGRPRPMTTILLLALRFSLFAVAVAASMTTTTITTTTFRKNFLPSPFSRSSSATSSLLCRRRCLSTTTAAVTSALSLKVPSSSSSSSFRGQPYFLLSRQPRGGRQTTNRRRFRSGAIVVMMPEGPEVRTLVDQLQGAVGRRLAPVRFLSGRYDVERGKPYPDGYKAFVDTMTPMRGINAVDAQQSGQEEPDVEGTMVAGTNSTTTAASATATAVAPSPSTALPNATAANGTLYCDLIRSVNCKGKFIYIILDDGQRRGGGGENNDDDDFQRSIWITLGMTGKFLNERAHERAGPRHARWYLELADVQRQQSRQEGLSLPPPPLTRIYYHDMRNFGTLKFCLSRQLLVEKLQSLGPDILASTTQEQDFLNILKAAKPGLNVCKFLMDQSKICGVGNYLLSEGLYRADIDPFCSIEELSDEQAALLFRELQATARESYEAQGMTRAAGGQHRTVDGSRGRFELELQCYGRDVCGRRGRPVRKDTNGPHGRTIWYTDEQLFVPRSQRKQSLSMLLKNGNRDSNSLSGAGGAAETRSRQFDDVLPATTRRARKPVDPSTATKLLLKSLEEPSWREQLVDATTGSESFAKLAVFLEEERADGAIVFPPRHEIFAALNLCPFEDVKVVIVGQDPYHGPGQGHGLAFSVKRGVRAPPSLQNIFKEVIEDIGIEPPHHGNLEQWARQGVLLLNTVLTVRQGEANSHANRGWEEFTDAVIELLNDRRENLVFLLWGNPAHKKARNVDPERHTVIRTSHPSPLGAAKTASPFLGSRCFSRANRALIEAGLDPIDWNVE